jgi:tetratricopeptide (TPR) repeat protein
LLLANLCYQKVIYLHGDNFSFDYIFTSREKEQATMSLLKLFYGPSPEKLEEKGDALFAAGHWGQAKLAYEGSLDKRQKRSGPDIDSQQRLEEKIRETNNALAREHRQTAQNLIEGGYLDEARVLLTLAAEVTADPQFKAELDSQLHALTFPQKHPTDREPMLSTLGSEDSDPIPDEASDDDYFLALCGTLPEEVQAEYLAYGKDFKSGYIALNRGDFQAAAESLSLSMAQNPQPESYIPLELASALLNLDRSAEARELLEKFLGYHPDALPAYQLLCEIHWEEKDFERIDALLASLPKGLAESVAAVMLKGETHFRAGRLADARDFYRQFLKVYGWNDTVARELAKAHEALNESAEARAIYREIMGRCVSCHARIDPAIRHRYAELCFANGLYTTEILEIYLALARELPENAALYFDRVSRIYAAQGNPIEAERFRSFARQASGERD